VRRMYIVLMQDRILCRGSFNLWYHSILGFFCWMTYVLVIEEYWCLPLLLYWCLSVFIRPTVFNEFMCTDIWLI
jgi:hypothetical protein